MSTTVTFAGNLAEDSELLHTHDQKPFVRCRVLVNRRIQEETGEWVNDEPTPHNVTIYGSAAPHVHDTFSSGDPIVVDNRFGEVGVSLKFVSPRIERAGRVAAQAG